VKVRITRGTTRHGEAIHKGQVLELPDNEAVTFMAYGQAERYEEPPAPAVKEEIQIQEPAVINQDPQIATGRRGRKGN
jgi:hypothetical protein